MFCLYQSSKRESQDIHKAPDQVQKDLKASKKDDSGARTVSQPSNVPSSSEKFQDTSAHQPSCEKIQVEPKTKMQP